MHLLQSGVDITVVALWLGHESPTLQVNSTPSRLSVRAEVVGNSKPDATVLV